MSDDNAFKVTSTLSFSKEEFATLATIGLQASILAAIQAQIEEVEIVDPSEELDAEEPELKSVGSDEQSLVLTFGEIRKLYEMAYRVSAGENSTTFELSSKFDTEKNIMRVRVAKTDYGDQKPEPTDITDDKHWLGIDD